MTKTLYIEKKDGINRGELSTIDTITKPRSSAYDQIFTIDGEDIQFIAIDTDDDIEVLKKLCLDYTESGIRSMFSGIVDNTRINGVVKKGVCIAYRGEGTGYMIETDIIDLRCQIIFPLVTKKSEKKVKFVPLDLFLPTDINTIDRRIKSMYILEGKGLDKNDYYHNIIYLLAIATNIYPPPLIWKHSRIPPEIEKLLEKIKGSGDLPPNLMPAYLIMNEMEMAYLDLEYYIGDIGLGQNTKRMSLVISPTQKDFQEGDNFAFMEKITNIQTGMDLGLVLKEMKIASDVFLGEGGTNKFNIKNDPNGKVTITFEKKIDPD